MAGPMARVLLLLLLLLAAPAVVAGNEVSASGNGTCVMKKVCEFACWNTEDEACFPGELTEFQCYQIYGHREWRDDKDCDCREFCEGEDPGPAQRDGGFEEKIANIFSIPAFIVLFRESLEVVLVLVIIIQFLQKSRANGTITEQQHTKFRREVYFGAGFGFLACICVGFGFLALISFALKDVKGEALLLLEGCLILITSAILSFMALNFYKMMYSKEAHERKMNATIAEAVKQAVASEGGSASFAKKHTFLVFAFMTGLREGLESILFLAAVVVDAKDLTSLPLPMITAVILARICGWCFFKGTNKVRVEYFMKGSACVLMFIAAGFFSVGTHNFQELAVFGTWSPKAERPWQNTAVFDASDCCNDKTNRFWVMIRALLGWQDQPTPVEFFAWFFYWMIIATFGYFMLKRVKKQLAEMKERWRLADEEAAAAEAGSADKSPKTLPTDQNLAVTAPAEAL